jgi:hypothetical protein
MRSIEALQALVASLTKSEKRYFRLFCDRQEGDKAYWRLYQILEAEPPGAARVQEAFGRYYPLPLLEAARKHLYKMLMKSLRGYHAHHSLQQRLLGLLQDVQILFHKGLAETGFAQLEKVKALALRHEQFPCYLLAAGLELQYLTELEFRDLEEGELVARQESINDVLYHQLFINKHASLYGVLLHRYFHRGAIRSPKELERLNDLLLEEHQVNANRRYPSFQSAKQHWLFQSTYFLMTGQYEESVALFGQLEALFSKHRELWAEAPVYYAYLVDGVLTGLRSLGKHDTMRTFIEGLKNVSLNTPGQLLQLNQVALGHELSLLIDAGEFERGLALWEAYRDRHPADAPAAPSRSGVSLYFPAAVVYFGLGRYPATLQLVNRVLNTHRAFLSAARYSLFRLLHLLVHYELGNLDYLGYEVRSVERQLRTRKRLFRSEKALLHFFKQSAGGARPAALLPPLHGQLTELGQDAYEKQLLGAFPFAAWAAARVQKVPFAQWLRQQAASQSV